jgi:hypothetical protein
VRSPRADRRQRTSCTLVLVAAALLHPLGVTAWAGADARAADAAADAGADAGAHDVDGADPATTTRDAAREIEAELPASVPQPPPAPALLALPGQIVARGTREPLPGVAIATDGRDASESDADGRFTLNLPAGSHNLSFQHPGHQPQVVTVTVAPQGVTEPLLVRLMPNDGAERYETIVRAPRREAEAPAVPLDRLEMTETPGSLGDPFRVIESLPGVASVLWPLPVFAVRGSNPGSTGFFMDDLRLPALFHFALGPAVIHPHLIESIDFYPGGYPARYGRYTGGIVAAGTATAPADRVRGAIDVRLYDAGLMLSSPIDQGRGTVSVAGRYAYPGALLSLLDEDISLDYWDYQLRVDHTLGPGKVTLFALGSYDQMATQAASSPDGTPREFRDRIVLMFHRLDLRWRGRVAGGWLKAGLAGGFDKTELPIDQTPLEVQARSLLPRLSFERPLGQHADLEVGVDGDITDYDKPVGDTRLEQADFLTPRTLLMAGVFTQVAARLGENLTLTPGLRLDFFMERTQSVAREMAVGPRLAARLRLSETVWLKAIGGRFAQMPHLPFQLPTFEGFGLGRHGLEASWQGSLGVEHKSPLGLELEATSFIGRGVLSDVRDPEFGDPLLNDFLIRREALAYGAELMIRRPTQHRVHGWLSYTLSRSQRAFDGGVVGPSDFDQTHTLNLVTSVRWGRTTFGGRLHFHTGRLVKIQNAEPLEMARLPSFHQIDLRVARRAIFDRFVLDVYLELVNATLRPQVTGLRDTPRGIEEDQFQLVLPSLGVRAEF